MKTFSYFTCFLLLAFGNLSFAEKYTHHAKYKKHIKKIKKAVYYHVKKHHKKYHNKHKHGHKHKHHKKGKKCDNSQTGPIEDVFAGGTGTLEDPYLIDNFARLQAMSLDLTASYRLASDIDAASYNRFDPIGTRTGGFASITTLEDGNFKVTYNPTYSLEKFKGYEGKTIELNVPGNSNQIGSVVLVEVGSNFIVWSNPNAVAEEIESTFVGLTLPFTGNFDGAGFTISNLTSKTLDEYSAGGLFSAMTNAASLTNVNFVNCKLEAYGNSKEVGGIVGYVGGITGADVVLRNIFIKDSSVQLFSPLNSFVAGFIGVAENRFQISRISLSGQKVNCYRNGAGLISKLLGPLDSYDTDNNQGLIEDISIVDTIVTVDLKAGAIAMNDVRSFIRENGGSDLNIRRVSIVNSEIVCVKENQGRLGALYSVIQGGVTNDVEIIGCSQIGINQKIAAPVAAQVRSIPGTITSSFQGIVVRENVISASNDNRIANFIALVSKAGGPEPSYTVANSYVSISPNNTLDLVYNDPEGFGQAPFITSYDIAVWSVSDFSNLSTDYEMISGEGPRLLQTWLQ